MAFLSGLEERFNKKMEELYSRQKFPMKESADLHPIIEYRPNDKDKPEGTGGSGRSAPVRRVLTDQKRMTKYLTSTQGIKFMLGQQVLQTGNIISETRIINPLFINLNLTPQSHTKRQLFDQTDVQVADPDRSPGMLIRRFPLGCSEKRECSRNPQCCGSTLSEECTLTHVPCNIVPDLPQAGRHPVCCH